MQGRYYRGCILKATLRFSIFSAMPLQQTTLKPCTSKAQIRIAHVKETECILSRHPKNNRTKSYTIEVEIDIIIVYNLLFYKC